MQLDFLRANLEHDSNDPAGFAQKGTICHPKDANLISSRIYDDKHLLLLDLDIEHFYTPSTNNGHLYINKALSFDAMIEILTVLQKHGIIQDGYLKGTKTRGHASLRVPGVSKNDPELNKGFDND